MPTRLVAEGTAQGPDRARAAAARAVLLAQGNPLPQDPDTLCVRVSAGETLTLDETYEAVSVVYESLGNKDTFLITEIGTGAVEDGELRVEIFAE